MEHDTGIYGGEGDSHEFAFVRGLPKLPYQWAATDRRRSGIFVRLSKSDRTIPNCFRA